MVDASETYFDVAEFDEGDLVDTPSANALAMQFELAQSQLEAQLLRSQLENERLLR